MARRDEMSVIPIARVQQGFESHLTVRISAQSF